MIRHLSLALCVGLIWGTLQGIAQAEKIDFDDMNRGFPVHFLFQNEIPNLETIDGEKIDEVLVEFVKAGNRLKDREQLNLVTLGSAFLHLVKNDFSKARALLEEEIAGPFILEDYRLHFLSRSYQELGRKAHEDGRYLEAIQHLIKSLELRLSLLREYPQSPFYENILNSLSLLEEALGNAYLEAGEYSEARKFYRRSLFREYSHDENFHWRIYLALAGTYEKAGAYEEANELYSYLLKENSNPETRQAARNFLDRHRSDLIFSNENLQFLEKLLLEEETTGAGRTRDTISKPVYKNLALQRFFELLEDKNYAQLWPVALTVLSEYPGQWESRKVITKLNKALLDSARQGPWNEAARNLLDYFPVDALNSLGYLMWRNGFPDLAAQAYRKIVTNHAAEVVACHKALFFLGRIYEDKENYSRAADYYQQLILKYDYGRYAAAAQFKIPWVRYLQKQWQEARAGFEDIVNIMEQVPGPPGANMYLRSDEYVPAALYWLARVEESLGNIQEKRKILERLIVEYPFDFYAVLGRLDLSENLVAFFQSETEPLIRERKPGLGERGREHLSRAERLIAVGFMGQGLRELKQVPDDRDNPDFQYYLARLFATADGFQDAINLSWRISKMDNHHSISLALAELLFPKAFMEKARKESGIYRLDPYLIMALIRQESAFNQSIVSSANAVGLMQLLPSTADSVARSLGQELDSEEDLKMPHINIQLGVKYLNELLKRFNDNPIYALAAYNAGPSKVRDWIKLRKNLKPVEFIESIPYNETRDYVKKVLRNFVIYKTLYDSEPIRNFDEMLKVRIPG